MPGFRIPKAVVARELDEEQFRQTVKLHEAFATGRPGGLRAIARLIVARRMRCDRKTLSDADFTGSDLSGTTFIGTKLQRASLHCANLAYTNFTGADLSRADLRGANLAAATLSGAVLDEADLRAAVLVASDELAGLRWIGGAGSLAGGRLESSRAAEATAHAVDFGNATQRGARLRGANLKHANFANANLAGADLKGAKLEGAVLKGAILTGIDVDALRLPPAQLKDCVRDPDETSVMLAERLLLGAQEMDRWARSSGREGRTTRLDGQDLRPLGGRLDGLFLPGVSARSANGIGVGFRGMLLAGATFDGADLRGADFTGADLRGASFRGANLAHARFTDADLGDLPLVNGALKHVDLDGALLVGTGLQARRDTARRAAAV